MRWTLRVMDVSEGVGLVAVKHGDGNWMSYRDSEAICPLFSPDWLKKTHSSDICSICPLLGIISAWRPKGSMPIVSSYRSIAQIKDHLGYGWRKVDMKQGEYTFTDIDEFDIDLDFPCAPCS